MHLHNETYYHTFSCPLSNATGLRIVPLWQIGGVSRSRHTTTWSFI